MCSVASLLRARQAQGQKLCNIAAYINKQGLHSFEQRPYGFECSDIRGSIEIPDKAMLKDKLHKMRMDGAQKAGILTDFD